MSQIYQRGKSKNYQIHFSLNGKLYQRSLHTKKKMRALYLQEEIDKFLDAGLVPDVERIVFGNVRQYENLFDFLSRIEENIEGNKSLAQATRMRNKVYLSHFRRFLTEHNLHHFLQIDMKTPVEYRNFRFQDRGKFNGDNVSPKTVKDELMFLKNSVFRRALREEIIDKNPFEFATENLRVYKNQREPFAVEEIKAILKNAPNQFQKDFYSTLYFTGSRFGEIANLKWKDVDFANDLITIRDTKEYHTKTRKTRTIPLHPRLKSIFLRQKETAKGELVFPSPHFAEEKPVRTFQNHFNKLKKNLAIDKHKSPHCFRHSFATHLKEAGVSIEVIRDLLGHADIRMTTKYQKTSMTQMKKAVRKIDIDL